MGMESSGVTDRVRAGHLRDFGVLFTRYVGSAQGYAYQFSRCAADVEDIVAEAFERVLGMLRRGLGPDDDAFAVYLRHTIRSVALDRLRKRAAERITEIADIAELAEPDLVAGVVVDQATDRAEQRLVRAFNRLSSRHRLVLMMTVVDGVPAGTVAMALGKTPNQVSALVYRARAKLRQLYEAEPDVHRAAPARTCPPMASRAARGAIAS